MLPSINGHLRNALIRQYQSFKGESYVPDVVPDTLKWTKSDPMNILKVQTDTQWQLIEKFKEKGTKYTPASGTVAIDINKLNKRKADEISSDTITSNNTPKKKPTDEKEVISSVAIISNKRPKTNLDIQNQDAPIGLIWDSCDHSCAYDVIVILFPISVYFVDNSFWTYAARFIICYCLYLHALIPESEYGTSQLLTSDSRYSYSVYTQYTQLLTSDSSCLIIHYSSSILCCRVLHTYFNVRHNMFLWLEAKQGELWSLLECCMSQTLEQTFSPSCT